MSIIFNEHYDKYKRAAFKLFQGVKVKLAASLSILGIYLVAWLFLGAMLGGLNGAQYFSIVALLFFALTILLGDKCLLFIVGARELSQKEKGIRSLISNQNCLSLSRPVKVYSFHHREIQACYIYSLFGQSSLLISDSLLSSENAMSLIEIIITKSNFNNAFLSNVAIMMSYQILFLGYVFSSFSKVASSLIFYILYPIVQIKDYLTCEKYFLGDGRYTQVFNNDDSKFKTHKIVEDIIKDFSSLSKNKSDLMSYAIEERKKRVTLE